MNITKEKQTSRYREHTSGYQREEREERKAQIGLRGQEVHDTKNKINKLQGYIAQNRKYSQHFILFYFIYFFSWRLITLQYCSGFCHTLK